MKELLGNKTEKLPEPKEKITETLYQSSAERAGAIMPGQEELNNLLGRGTNFDSRYIDISKQQPDEWQH